MEESKSIFDQKLFKFIPAPNNANKLSVFRAKLEKADVLEVRVAYDESGEIQSVVVIYLDK